MNLSHTVLNHIIRRRNYLIPLAIMSIGIYGILLGFLAPPAYRTEPDVFVEFSIALRNSWDILGVSPKPPLRHVFFTTIITILDVPDTNVGFVGNIFFAILQFVIYPIIVYTIVKKEISEDVAIPVMISLMFVPVIDVPNLGYTLGEWHYIGAGVLLFITILVQGHLINKDMRIIKHSVVIGILLTSTALYQIIYAGIAAMVVAVSGFINYRWRHIVGSGLISGAIFGLVWITGTIDQAPNESVQIGLESTSRLVTVITAPGNVITIIAGAIIASLIYKFGYITRSRSLESLIFVSYLFWLIGKFTLIDNHLDVNEAYLARAVGYYLGWLLPIPIVAIITKEWDDYLSTRTFWLVVSLALLLGITSLWLIFPIRLAVLR